MVKARPGVAARLGLSVPIESNERQDYDEHNWGLPAQLQGQALALGSE